MVMAKDETLDPPTWPNASRFRSGYQTPEILFDDDFDKGFGNWRNHQGGNDIYPAISRTSLRSFGGSSKSLMISTGSRPQQAGIKSANAGTYNNLSRWVDNGLVKFEAWIALGGADLDNSPHNVQMMIDTQTWDDKSRGFYRMMCRRFTGPADNIIRANQWGIQADNGDTIVIPAMNGQPAPPYIGDNENKMNFFYVSLTADLDFVGPDGYRGRYYETEHGPYKYDLTKLGAGRGKTNPQIKSSVGAGSFAGGLNFGLGVQNRTVYQPAGPSWLLVGRARALWYPKAEG